MKHIKHVEDFLNEHTINESDAFISDAKFTDQRTFEADILKNAGPALEKFLKARGFNWPGDAKISIENNSLEIQSKLVTGKDLGLLQWVIKTVGFEGVGRFNYQAATAKSDFEFTPLIKIGLRYAYTHGGPDAGPKGLTHAPLHLPDNQGQGYDNQIWYDIVKGVWLNNKDAQKAGF